MQGLDYKLYLMSKYVDTKAGERLSRPKLRVSDIKAFENFHLAAPPSVNPTDYPACLYAARSFQCSSVRHN